MIKTMNLQVHKKDESSLCELLKIVDFELLYDSIKEDRDTEHIVVFKDFLLYIKVFIKCQYDIDIEESIISNSGNYNNVKTLRGTNADKLAGILIELGLVMKYDHDRVTYYKLLK